MSAPNLMTGEILAQAGTQPPARPGTDMPLDMPLGLPPLFVRANFRQVAGGTLRPGGLPLTRHALALADLPAAALVADLGCGPGATARLLTQAGHRVLALDSNPELLDAARGPGVSPLLARAQALPLADACLDAVFCECVLSVTGAASAVLTEAGRVLKPGGVLVLSDLYLRDKNGLRGEADPAQGAGDCLSGALPERWLLNALQATGFAVQSFEDHSRMLTELAARLVFAGISRAELGFGCEPGARPGYFLCLARTRAQ